MDKKTQESKKSVKTETLHSFTKEELGYMLNGIMMVKQSMDEYVGPELSEENCCTEEKFNQMYTKLHDLYEAL